jgi:hypothetical protein
VNWAGFMLPGRGLMIIDKEIIRGFIVMVNAGRVSDGMVFGWGPWYGYVVSGEKRWVGGDVDMLRKVSEWMKGGFY